MKLVSGFLALLFADIFVEGSRIVERGVMVLGMKGGYSGSAFGLLFSSFQYVFSSVLRSFLPQHSVWPPEFSPS